MSHVIELENLHVAYGRAEAVRGLQLKVEAGRCHALFGRNGAGKTTTMKALLGLVPVVSGRVRLCGLDPMVHEAEVKSKVAWVPDSPGFYPWMTVRGALEFSASLRASWSREVEQSLLERFGLDAQAPTTSLSKGQKTQLALICAVAADPEVLILDEPTSGLDPLVRRQFIEAVISAFQDRNPERKTLFISTHLISEFEGVVDDFTLMEAGRDVLTLNADEARLKYQRVRGWFDGAAPASIPLKTVQAPRHEGRMVEFVVNDEVERARSWLTEVGAARVEASALSLEEIFLAAVH